MKIHYFSMIALGSFILIGCAPKDEQPSTGPGIESPGNKLIQTSASNFTWGPGNDEIFYVESPGIKAARLSDGTVRTIDVTNDSSQITSEGGVKISADGLHAYFSSLPFNNNETYTLRWVSTQGGTAHIIKSGLQGSAVVIPSADNNHVVFSPRSAGSSSYHGIWLYLHDVDSSQYLRDGIPALFSPDGQTLLFYDTYYYNNLYLLNINTNQIISTLHYDLNNGEQVVTTWFDSLGVQIIYLKPPYSLVQKNLSVIAYEIEIGEVNHYYNPYPDVWSKDRKQAIGWTIGCIQGYDDVCFLCKVSSCELWDKAVWVFKYENGKTSVNNAANVHVTEQFGYLYTEFSSDGHRFAYLANGSLYYVLLQ